MKLARMRLMLLVGARINGVLLLLLRVLGWRMEVPSVMRLNIVHGVDKAYTVDLGQSKTAIRACSSDGRNSDPVVLTMELRNTRRLGPE